MSFFDNVDKIFKDWNYNHPRILYSLIRAAKPRSIIEVGTYRGLGAAWMAKAAQENNFGLVTCIDDFSLTDHEARYGDARRHLHENLLQLGVRDWVTIIEGKSDQVKWPESCDFAYIDGWHGYLACKSDFDNAADLGAQIICLDDTTQSVGPRMVVDEVRESGKWDVLDLHHDCGMTICSLRKPKGVITFSQELPNHPGVDLQVISPNEQRKHLQEAQRVNGVDYSSILPHLHPGRLQ